ncbi:MAG: hypothetical protein ACRDKS_06930, partial [Actinomycetota bacterium]
MSRMRSREGFTEDLGGIRITQRRPPLWLLFVIVAIAAWGLFYLITFSVTETGTFQAPAALIRGALGV